MQGQRLRQTNPLPSGNYYRRTLYLVATKFPVWHDLLVFFFVVVVVAVVVAFATTTEDDLYL